MMWNNIKMSPRLFRLCVCSWVLLLFCMGKNINYFIIIKNTSLLHNYFCSDTASLKCKPQKLEVVKGDQLLLLCYSEVIPIYGCKFSFPGLPTNIKIHEGVISSKYDFQGNYAEGVCGIRFFNATKNLQGLVTIQVVLIKSENVIIDEAQINVTIQPIVLLQPSKNYFHL